LRCHPLLGGAKLADKHLAATVHCVDDEIIGWLERRERLSQPETSVASEPEWKQLELLF
jgi:hypothetical protein